MDENGVKLFFFLIKHHVMETYGRLNTVLNALLTLTVDGGALLASCPGRSAPPLPIRRKAGWTP
jgi:hypothetical protein